MHAQLRRLAAGVVLTVAVAACAGTASRAPTPAPTPPLATPVGERFAIRTPVVEPQACMEALMSGTLTRNPQSGRGIMSADRRPTAVEWPFGYSATIASNRVSLFDKAGKLVAREGDEITIGGGFGNLLWYACGPLTVTKAAG